MKGKGCNPKGKLMAEVAKKRVARPTDERVTTLRNFASKKSKRSGKSGY